jgi:uncharacterized integral membrane protein
VASPDSAQAPAKRSRRETMRAVVLVVLAVFITLFAVLNVKKVEVNWIFGTTRTPLIIVIVASLVVGILLTHFAEMRNRRKS